MRKILKLGIICLIGYGVLTYTGLLSDKAQLQEGLIRMHVVANSDSEEDQSVKLQVKDAVVAYLQPKMEEVTDKQEAKEFITENITRIEAIANEKLQQLGVDMSATACLTQEAFDLRQYDTFKLPSGVYDSLRITIGEGEGKNWWCVAFPSLCMPATADAFAHSAASAGFSDSLVDTISENEDYEVRFYFLDLLGRMEKFFH